MNRALLVVSMMCLLAGAADAADVEAGKIVFQNTCAVCHGATGSPDPSSPVIQGLGVTPADLSDPLFNSREPTADWEMVVKYGGQALGLAAQMPAHKDVLSDEEIADVIAYVKSMVDTSAYPPGEMNLFLPVRTKKAFPEDEVVYKGVYTSLDGSDAWKNVLEIEKRFGKAGQAILELVHVNAGDVNELTAAELGWKQALSWSKTHIVSAAAVWVIPIDQPDTDGQLQTYLAFGKVLSPSWIFQSSLRLKFPFDDASTGSAELAGVVHYTHSPWPRSVFPALEIVGVQPFGSRDGDLEWTALPQLRFGLTRGGHVALNLGIELPLSGQDWDNAAHLTLLWDFADGSLFKGW